MSIPQWDIVKALAIGKPVVSLRPEPIQATQILTSPHASQTFFLNLGIVWFSLCEMSGIPIIVELKRYSNPKLLALADTDVDFVML